MVTALGCRIEKIQPISHLFPDAMLGLMCRPMWRTLRGKLALSSVRLFHKYGWLPRLFPSRIFAEVRVPGAHPSKG
jgi:hypothetical protein